ncbi:hypothetical protein, partial [Pseudomonas fluorescens]|uniref:hypothetical protein n=1 Tax=Pseudomonas fluorescens TaxID=294 RepID=UPI002B1D5E18
GKDNTTSIQCYPNLVHDWVTYQEYRDLKEPKTQVYKGSAAASKIPGFKYIPLCALERLAKRFELGLERHRQHAWNPLDPVTAKMLDDKEW